MATLSKKFYFFKDIISTELKFKGKLFFPKFQFCENFRRNLITLKLNPQKQLAIMFNA